MSTSELSSAPTVAAELPVSTEFSSAPTLSSPARVSTSSTPTLSIQGGSSGSSVSSATTLLPADHEPTHQRLLVLAGVAIADQSSAVLADETSDDDDVTTEAPSELVALKAAAANSTSAPDSADASTVLACQLLAIRAAAGAGNASSSIASASDEHTVTESTESALAVTPTVAAATAVEQLMTRLHALSDGFVFTHILPTGTLGEGAFGKVSRGVYMGRNVAFKLQKSHEYMGATAADVARLADFEREARMLAAVAEPTHRHCLGFLGVAVDSSVGIALVTELVSGGDLRDWLRLQGPFEVVDGLELLAGLGSGLVFLHEAGVIHGDVKPENILLEYEEGSDGGRRVYGKWIDLGGGYPYWRGRTAYTPRYGSPEQLSRQPTEAGSDVFSFGCVVLEVLTGQRPDHPRYAASPPLQRAVTASSAAQAVAQARSQLLNELHRLLPDGFPGSSTLVELLVDSWKEHVYSRPRTVAVCDTLQSVLASANAERAAALAERLSISCPPPCGNSPLMAAVQYCDVAEVERLVSAGLAADEGNRWGHTPLHVAAAVDHAGVLELLLSTEPALRSDNFGNTPLDIAYEQSVVFGCGENSLPALRRVDQRARERRCRVGEFDNEEASPLRRAVAQQDFGATKVLLDGGADMNTVDGETGETALHLAARLKANDIVSLLVHRGANVNATDSARRRTPLHVAVLSSEVAVVSTLVVAGADIELPDSDNMTPLLLACRNGNSDVVTALLSGPSVVDLAADSGTVAFLHAASCGHVRVVAVLLQHGAQVDNEWEEGMTALFTACERGHVDVAKALVEAGAEVDKAVCEGWTPLMAACSAGHVDVVELLLRLGAVVDITNEHEESPLVLAAGSGHADVVARLCAGGATVNMDGDCATTPLIAACANGHADVANAVLENGAAIDFPGYFGTTALMEAAQNGHADVVALLLAAGAGVDETASCGWSPLIFAAQNGDSDTIAALLGGGATVDLTSNAGWTSLVFASAAGNKAAVCLLLNAGANVNAAASDGETALTAAAALSNDDIIDELLAAGAAVDATTTEGLTALTLAAKDGHVSCVARLLAAGADIGAGSPTAVEAAWSGGHDDVVAMLEG